MPHAIASIDGAGVWHALEVPKRRDHLLEYSARGGQMVALIVENTGSFARIIFVEEEQ